MTAHSTKDPSLKTTTRTFPATVAPSKWRVSSAQRCSCQVGNTFNLSAKSKKLVQWSKPSRRKLCWHLLIFASTISHISSANISSIITTEILCRYVETSHKYSRWRLTQKRAPTNNAVTCRESSTNSSGKILVHIFFVGVNSTSKNNVRRTTVLNFFSCALV